MRNPLKKPRITLNLNIKTNLSNHLPSFPLTAQHMRRTTLGYMTLSEFQAALFSRLWGYGNLKKRDTVHRLDSALISRLDYPHGSRCQHVRFALNPKRFWGWELSQYSALKSPKNYLSLRRKKKDNE